MSPLARTRAREPSAGQRRANLVGELTREDEVHLIPGEREPVRRRKAAVARALSVRLAPTVERLMQQRLHRIEPTLLSGTVIS